MIDLRNSIYFQINAEAWQFFKQALPVQDNDRYWGEILTEGEKVVKKSELERICKAGSFDSLQSGTEKPRYSDIDPRKKRQDVRC